MKGPVLVGLALFGAQAAGAAPAVTPRQPAVIVVRNDAADFAVLSSHVRRRGDRLWVWGRVARSTRLATGRCTITVRDRAASVLGQIPCAAFPARGAAVVSFAGTVPLPDNGAEAALDVQVQAGPAGARPSDPVAAPTHS